jgi:peptidoglycan hydrolase-like protein with peptidoglycan-binding domain
MESFAYLHAAAAYEAADPDAIASLDEAIPFENVNWPHLSAQTAANALAIICSLSVLSVAGGALALQRNDSGSAVTTLQNDLARAGYYNGPVTGFYGELTESAILRFQRENGLTADGVAGTQTLAALRSRVTSGGSASPTQAFAATSSTPTSPAANNPATTNTLKLGAQGPAVADLQTRLKSAGYFDGPITSYYGSLTEASVTRFQQAKQIAADGAAGPQTLAALQQTSRPTQSPTPTTQQPPAQGGPAEPVTTGTLQRGDRGDAVTTLQNRLKTAGVFDGPVTGFYGSLTEEAVRRFQQAKGLSVDGVAGPRTMAALMSGSPTASRPPAQGSPSTGTTGSTGTTTTTTTLQRGDRGVAVADLQNRLRNAGYFNGPMTGFYGSLTEEAVSRFQQAKGFSVDGKAGPQTLTALRQTSSTQAGTPPTQGTPTSSTTGVLQRGDSSQAVTDLQNRLKAAGYFNGPVTGYFGSLTEEAVSQFQRARGLTVDGRAGAATLSALRGSGNTGSTASRPTPATSPSPQARTTNPSPQAQASPSTQARAASPSPQASTQARAASPSPQAATQARAASPSPQASTQARVASPSPQASAQARAANSAPQALSFSASPQRANPSPSSQATNSSRAQGDSTASATTTHRLAANVLQKGDSGPAVVQLQTSLKQSKYLEGQVTGFFGELTEDAVKKFQKAQGLSVDGKAGQQTLTALRRVSGNANL